MAVTPLLKAKVDELFLRWLSMPETQKILHEDLERVIEGRPIAEKTDKNVLSNLTVGSSRSVSPPAPSSSPTPSRSPRSPRDVRALRKSGTKTPPISPRLERHGSGKNLMKEHVKIDLNGSEIREELLGHMQTAERKQRAGACNLPLYWKQPLFACAGGNKNGFVTLPMFTSMWRRNICAVDALRWMGCTGALGVALKVIARIFYSVNSSWTGKITIPEVRHSNFLEVLASLEEEEDINEV
ncbi:predicted protein [Nematostella vectensis]|uniref:Uncharacterized protein n=1 Tax=Nematostella vectensis TaxID=45351 RepID=A7T499_NEMVE|nr:predicted protein [Nematostella vectensis]|eukprot:XP_001621315.1 hypothetical protein NEMVEDRAFT_v1g222122 [Nematostella vectensis]